VNGHQHESVCCPACPGCAGPSAAELASLAGRPRGSGDAGRTPAESGRPPPPSGRAVPLSRGCQTPGLESTSHAGDQQGVAGVACWHPFKRVVAFPAATARRGSGQDRAIALRALLVWIPPTSWASAYGSQFRVPTAQSEASARLSLEGRLICSNSRGLCECRSVGAAGALRRGARRLSHSLLRVGLWRHDPTPAESGGLARCTRRRCVGGPRSGMWRPSHLPGGGAGARS